MAICLCPALFEAFLIISLPFGSHMNHLFQDLTSSISDEHCGVLAVDWDLKDLVIILRQMKVRTGLFGGVRYSVSCFID